MARSRESELDAGAKGELAAALWLRVAEAARRRIERRRRSTPFAARSPRIRAAFRRARSSSICSARAADGAALAAALEATAERVTTDRARAALYLVAADAWARLARDAQGARAALSQAAHVGRRAGCGRARRPPARERPSTTRPGTRSPPGA